MPDETLPSNSVRFLLSGDANEWSEADIEMALNRHSTIVRDDILRAITADNLVWQASVGDLGIPYSLRDGDGQALTPTNTDLPNGRFIFSAAPGAVLLDGISFGVHLASADLLRSKAAAYAGDLRSFSGQGGSYTYAEKSKSYLEMAAEYEAIASRRAAVMGIVSGYWVRSDSAWMIDSG